jgi:hypothetical protein
MPLLHFEWPRPTLSPSQSRRWPSSASRIENPMPPIQIVIPRSAERPLLSHETCPRFMMNCQVCFERIRAAMRQCTDERQPLERPPTIIFIRDRCPMQATCPECGTEYEARMKEEPKDPCPPTPNP